MSKITNKILIVDDKADNLLSLETVLKGLDIIFIRALSGNDALKQIITHEFALILLDIQMPQMDGYETLRLIRLDKRAKHTPVILFSAIYKDDFHNLKGFEEGAVDFISKPVHPEVIQRKVKTFIELYNQKKVLENEIINRKKIEQELIKSKEKAEESNRLKTAFLSNMSHEIRTPLNGILGFSGLLQEPKLTGTEKQEYIKTIQKSGKRMLNIINNIMSISKIETGMIDIELEESNINEQIEYIHTFFKPDTEAKGLQFSFKNTLPSSEAILKTDTEKVHYIVSNLVKNAIKYSEKGSIEFGYNLKEKFLEFYVTDTGIGIQNDRQEAIFERFIQADIADKMATQGAGLGLAISKNFVEILGGEIWVESEVKKGSTFYFTLPYTRAKKIAINKDIVPIEASV